MKPLILSLAIGLALSGCSSLVHTPYQQPELALPAAWQDSDATPRSTTDSGWWRAFGDAQLNQLVEDVLAGNNDLAVAAIKVRQAQLNADLAEGSLLPSLAVDLSSSASRSLKSGGSTTRSHGLSTTVSYELDLWGKLGRARDAKVWEAAATEQDRQSSALSLAGTSTKLYWQIAYLKQRLDLADASLAYLQRVADLVGVQKAAGAKSALELISAEQAVASQEASRSDIAQQLYEARNALALLFASPSAAHYQEPAALPDAAPPAIAAGLPAELLARRPDLRAAEMRLQESLATVDATRASYYPSFSLTGSLGSSSTKLADVLRNPVATLGAGLSLPFVEWRDMQRNVQVSELDYQSAILSFRQTLYQALVDVDNALSAGRQYQLQADKLGASLAAARKLEALYEVRYRAGAATLQDWLDAQETRRQAEISLAENRYNQYLNQTTLYLALGG